MRTEEGSHPSKVKDIDGTAFHVLKRRATPVGVILYYGKHDLTRRGPPQLILTSELAEHFKSHSKAGGTWRVGDIGLGLPQTVKTKIVKRLGMNLSGDRARWWQDRKGDLFAMTLVDFSKRHNVSTTKASLMRAKLKDLPSRPSDWWRAPNVAALLLSNEPVGAVAKRLGVTYGQCRRMRDILRAEHGRQEDRRRKPKGIGEPRSI